MWRFAGLALCAIACGEVTATAEPSSIHASKSDWHASNPRDADPRSAHVDPDATWKEAARTIVGDACGDGQAVLVWGDLRVAPPLHPRAVDVSLGDRKPELSGFVLCMPYMEDFLKLQVDSPRFVGGRGGSADVTWRDGTLFMRRRWSAGDIDLGRLDPPPEGVFQKGEALAALVSCDPKARPGDVIPALARVPKVFVFGMLPFD